MPNAAEDCENRLRNLNAEYEEFAYIVSHDLKAPVRAISNLLTWLEDDLEGNLPGDSKENFGLVKNRLGRLDKMIQSLLDFSRVPRLHLETRRIDLAQELKWLPEQLPKDKALKLEISGQIPVLETFAEKLIYVLKELLQNAFFFNDKPAVEITVNLEDTPENVMITITDNGPGVPESSLNKIFVMFYTVQPKDRLETTGAGLAIVNKIVTFAGGKIKAENNPAGGLKISITWPKSLNKN